jgi:pimeloyl-ACP methyl ester carboxylesterase
MMASGCAMQRTAREARTAATLGVIAGTVQSATGTDDTYVLLFAVAPDGSVETTGVSKLSDLSNAWGFVFEEGRPFVIGAFKDGNGDGVRDAGEPAAYIGVDNPMTLGAETRMRGVVITLDTATETSPRFPLDVRGDAGIRQAALRFSMGEVVSLDDPRFDPEQVSKGMWTPLAALRENGGGVFFLEPYDPGRIPVLFVHGIGGSPRDLRVLIERLDRTRFQPWIYYYPSGFRLATLANGLSRNLPALRKTLGFKTIYVVAHSMGGLVSRAAILNLDADPQQRDMVGLFVTFASPLGGHYAVKWGLKFTPEPVPSWIDLEPGSEFITSISKPLPPRIPYYLLFGFHRGGGVLMPSSSDSTVPVGAQLPMWAQRDAVRMWGFDSDHMQILAQEEPVTVFLDILDKTYKAGTGAAQEAAGPGDAPR